MDRVTLFATRSNEFSNQVESLDLVQENVFGSKSNACNLAYSKVQVSPATINCALIRWFR